MAAPGALTTAGLLLSLNLGHAPNFKHMVFSEIMPAVARGEADYGLIIHEGRFTLAEHGLASLLDLGQWWEQEPDGLCRWAALQSVAILGLTLLEWLIE